MKYLALFLLVTTSFLLFGQKEVSKGKEFWFGFMQSNSVNATEVYITYYDAFKPLNYSAKVTVSIPGQGGWNKSYTLENGHSIKVIPPTAFAYVNSTNIVEGKAVRVMSNENVEVRIATIANGSVDAASIIPLKDIPNATSYYSGGYFGSVLVNKSQILLVATENNTKVQITPSANLFEAQDSGKKFTVTLQKGQVYQIKSDNERTLSGTEVKVVNGCQKLIVFAGNQCSPVSLDAGCQSCDLLMTQMVPTDYWGVHYLLSPFKDATGGYVFQVIALKDNTVVSMNGSNIATLNKGEYIYQDITSPIFSKILGDKPIMVHQFLKSESCFNHLGGLGDPSMISISPFSTITKHTSIRIPHGPNLLTHWVNVIVKIGQENLLKHNGQVVPIIEFNAIAAEPGYTMAQLSITDSIQHLESDSGFYAVSYGYGSKVSYGLEITRAFNIPGYFIDTKYPYLCNNGNPFPFKVTGDSAVKIYWEFKDGPTRDSGNTVYKTIPKDSTNYSFRVIVKNKNKECPIDTLDERLPVYPAPIFDFGISDTTICNGSLVNFGVNIPNVTYLWNNGSTSKSYFTRKAETVTLELTNKYGCKAYDSCIVRISACEDTTIAIPNVMTPNGDGLNDAFLIKHYDYKTVTGIIYNRWGNKIYKFELPKDESWNGKVDNTGEECPSGTYFYVVKMSNSPTKKDKETSGTITILKNKK